MQEWESPTSNWKSTEAPLLFQSLCFSNSGITAKNDRVEDEAIFVSLDFLDHLCLFIGRTVVVNNTQTSLQCHMDSHFVLGNGIHGGRHERGFEGDALGDGRLEDNLGSSETNVTWKDKEIVVSQTSMSFRIEQRLDIEAIAFFILFEDLEGLRMVENGGGLRVAVRVRHLDRGNSGIRGVVNGE